MHKVPVFLIETESILRRYCSHSTKYVRFAIPLCLHEVGHCRRWHHAKAGVRLI